MIDTFVGGLAAAALILAATLALMISVAVVSRVAGYGARVGWERAGRRRDERWAKENGYERPPF